MIPHRMLTSEICGNGLKDRVTACRRRLRVNRVAHKARVNNDPENLSYETAPSASRFQDYTTGNPPEWPALPSSVARLNCVAPFADVEPGDSEKMSLVGQQEVGIT